jgi:hypothetical protein
MKKNRANRVSDNANNCSGSSNKKARSCRADFLNMVNSDQLGFVFLYFPNILLR